MASRASFPDAGNPVCPGCGAAIDPLRAGQVAILGGDFVYFCDSTCKANYLEAFAPGTAQDVETLAPPPVAPTLAPLAGRPGLPAFTAPPSAVRDVRGSGAAEYEEDFRALAMPLHDFVLAEPDPRNAPRSQAPATENSERQMERAAPVGGACPAKGRSSGRAAAFPPPRSPPPERSARAEGEVPMVAARPFVSSTVPAPSADPAGALSLTASRAGDPDMTPPEGRASRRRAAVASAATWVGLGCGVLAPATILAADIGSLVLLPLASVAVLAVVIRAALGRREPGDPSATPAATLLVVAAFASWAARLGDDGAQVPAAAFTGLAAAVVSFAEVLIARRKAGPARARRSLGVALAGDVRVRRAGILVTEQADRVHPGEQVRVDQDEYVGVDGVVVAGEAVVCPWVLSRVEARKTEGARVVAGARVVSGWLEVRASRTGGDRTFTRVAEAHLASQAPPRTLLAFSEHLAARGAPLAAALALAFARVSGASWVSAAIVACAFALPLALRSTRAAVGLAHERGELLSAAHGAVYRDGAAFERAGRAEVAVLCSRGTVLMGEPEIVAIEPLAPQLGIEPLLALAAGAESASTHPFAAAVLRAARTRAVRPAGVRGAAAYAGLGVTAHTSAGEPLVVGSRAFLLQEKVSVALADARITELEAQGRSVLLVATAGRLLGLIALQDGLRAGARAAVQRLLDSRIEPVLLSGEARETCEALGRALDIEHVRPEVLPADRAAEVRALAEGGRIIAVVGRPGVDDAALGASDVAVALDAAVSEGPGAPGSRGALDFSLVLASDDIRDAAFALASAHTGRDRARVAFVAGLLPSLVVALALVSGIGGPSVSPVAALFGLLVALGAQGGRPGEATVLR